MKPSKVARATYSKQLRQTPIRRGFIKLHFPEVYGPLEGSLRPRRSSISGHRWLNVAYLTHAPFVTANRGGSHQPVQITQIHHSRRQRREFQPPRPIQIPRTQPMGAITLPQPPINETACLRRSNLARHPRLHPLRGRSPCIGGVCRWGRGRCRRV